MRLAKNSQRTHYKSNKLDANENENENNNNQQQKQKKRKENKTFFPLLFKRRGI